MPVKRPASGTSQADSNWKKRKQDRAHNARLIQTQQSSASALLTPTPSASSSPAATPGPSSSSTQTAPKPAQKLPAQLELESAISSRTFQIHSFQKSLKSAKSAITTRAWQLLPRHARRRAASHNLLRLPTRLRTKAQAELNASKTTARTRSEIRKRLPSHGVIKSTLRRKKLADRAAHPQRSWLETHLWHAKRFRMSIDKGKGKEMDQGVQTSRWGFVVPETTMMKSHKASWRSALERVTVHDASYYSVFRVGAQMIVENDTGLDGNEEETAANRLTEQLAQCLKRAGFADGSSNEAVTAGSVQCSTVLIGECSVADVPAVRDEAMNDDELKQAQTSSSKSTAYAALVPVRILWLPQLLKFVSSSTSASKESDAMMEEVNAGKPSYFLRRELLVLVHPAGEEDVRTAFSQAGLPMEVGKKAVHASTEDEIILTAQQLDSAPDPWVAAGGKDASTSKLQKTKQRQHKAADQTVGSARSRKGSWRELDVHLQRQRAQGYNIFELVGPESGKLLANVLKLADKPAPSEETPGTETIAKQALGALRRGLPSASATEGNKAAATAKSHVDIPNGTVLALDVHDPRLSFPPKSAWKSEKASDADVHLVPSIRLASGHLLSYGNTAPQFSKGEIDSRRAKQAVPGSRLEPQSNDDVVPVVIIKQEMAGSIDKLTLIVPRSWGTAFFLSLVNTHQSGSSSGARVLGQKQIKHQSLEVASRGVNNRKSGSSLEGLFFPSEWIGTRAYAEEENEASQLRKEEWQRRPRGKRVEHEFVSTAQSRPLWTDQQTMTKMANDRIGSARLYPFGGAEVWEWAVHNSNRLFGSDESVDDEVKPWLAPLSSLEASSVSLLQRREASLNAGLYSTALVPIKLTAIRKGTVEVLGSIIFPPTFEDQQEWIRHVDVSQHPYYPLTKKTAEPFPLDRESVKQEVEHRLERLQLGGSAPARKPSPPFEDASKAIQDLHDRSADWSRTVGFVMSGDYSLGKGKGFGVGAVTLRAWVELLQREERRTFSDGSAVVKGGRKKRNPIETSNLLLVRQVGTDVIRPCSAVPIGL